MKELLHHFFIPRFSNNHRAKILHHKSVFVIIIALWVATFFLSTVKTEYPQVLGVAYDISAQDLLILTNKERQEKGLNPLIMNDRLSKAAFLKAQDMFAKDYWAHNSPTGDTPWVFIKKSGYEYTYAGENLARGFTNGPDVVTAWMDSQSHRENMLSPNYTDIGFAIVDGEINGEDTVLVVEMFGNTTSPFLANGAKKDVNEAISSTTPVQSRSISSGFVQALRSEPVIDSFSLVRNLGLFMVLLLIGALTLDLIITKRKKVVRIVGHNMDHILFFMSLVVIIIAIGRGVVL